MHGPLAYQMRPICDPYHPWREPYYWAPSGSMTLADPFPTVRDPFSCSNFGHWFISIVRPYSVRWTVCLDGFE